MIFFSLIPSVKNYFLCVYHFIIKKVKMQQNQPIETLLEIPRVSVKFLLIRWGKVSKCNTRLRLQNYPPIFPQGVNI